MTKLKPIKSQKLIKIVKKLGFKLDYVKGSHHIFKNQNGKRMSIPVHKGKLIGKGLLLQIIEEDLGLTKKEFEKLLKE